MSNPEFEPLVAEGPAVAHGVDHDQCHPTRVAAFCFMARPEEATMISRGSASLGLATTAAVAAGHPLPAVGNLQAIN